MTRAEREFHSWFDSVDQQERFGYISPEEAYLAGFKRHGELVVDFIKSIDAGGYVEWSTNGLLEAIRDLDKE